nr:hypothetical protein GCM10020093_049840 [Planobispora longispora]
MDGIGGRVALVTGAGRGIGAAVCEALAAAGAGVAAADLRIAGPDGAAHDGTAHDGTGDGAAGAAPYALDVRDPRAVGETVAAVERDLGPIDILVNVAGVLRPASVVETRDDDWQQTFAVNTDGVFHLCREVARRMLPGGGGDRHRGIQRRLGAPGRHGGLRRLQGRGDHVHPLPGPGAGSVRDPVQHRLPGSTDTSMLRALWEGKDPADAWSATLNGDPAAFRTGIPLGRIAEPRDISDAVLFLVSDHARHITMHDLLVDGGATLRA